MKTEGNMNLEPAQREIMTFWSFGTFGCSRNPTLVSVLMWIGVKYSNKEALLISFFQIFIHVPLKLKLPSKDIL